ncbi:hen1 methyltransferase [Bombus fervidus]|uniref:hen1 methyltransferase n=1 Tax=Bombus fervidus TaxID=203811 RepID=UPI003AB79D14
MIIVLFHVIYFFGKFVYQNYRNKRQKAMDNRTVNTEPGLKTSESDHKVIVPEASQHFEENIKFFPPAYIQRYAAVADILSCERYQGKLRKIVDFGCAELGFLTHLKNTKGIQEILCVDINRPILEAYKTRGAPLVSEYLHRRTAPFVIEISEGCVTQSDKRLENADAVICIELIEHLYPDTLTNLPYNIFGYIKPILVVMTTPNADFNALFPNFSGFRHPDHKFEWTRQQFQDWAENITLRYPNYIVTFHGICKGPEGSEHLGCCTQMAVFHRIYEKEETYSPGIENLFKVVARYEYPFQVDNRSDEEKIVDEASYYIRHLSYQDDMEEEVPLKLILKMLHTFPITMDELETILGDAGWAIEEREDGPVVLVPPPSTYSDTTVDGPLWSNDMYASEEDDWNTDSEQPINYSRQDGRHENWNVESSIVIPVMSPSNSMLEDDTYIYGEKDVLFSSEFETTRSAEISDKYSEINNEGNIDSILGTDNFNKSFDNNDPLYLNESTELSDSSVTRNLKSLYITSDTQNDAVSDTAQKLNCTLDLVYMSISRASTSPEPYLLHAVKMDQQLTNDSICNQSMSDHWMLNNSLQQENISINTIGDVNDEESKKSSLKYDFDGYDHLNDIYSNTLYKEDEDSDIDTNTAANTNPIDQNHMQSIEQSSNVSEHNCHLKDQLQSDNIIASVNNILTDNQPQFTSSPKMESRKDSVGKKRRSLDYEEEENNTNSLNISQKSQFTSPGSNNLLESRNEEVPLQSNIDTNIAAMSGIKPNTIGERYSKQDTSMYQNDTKVKSGNELIKNFDQDTLNSSDTATICPTLDGDKQTIDELPETNFLSSNNGTKNNETLRREITDLCATEKLVKEEKELPAINTNNIQSVNCDTKIQLTKSTIDEKTDLKSELHNNHDLRSVVTEMFRNDAKDARDIESTSVLKNEEQDECNVENRELKPSPETVETLPNSWFPEVIDSGYPNTASAQDMIPEYALSSIAQGHISDSESSSITEAVRPEILDVIEVENGDLANNNRDGEGNNMIAAELNELEDLQPLIEVLENDIENENDIYGVENDFPLWLLGILNMVNPIDVDIDMQNHRELMFPNRAAGGNARYINMERDEGFDNSSEGNSDLENNEM